MINNMVGKTEKLEETENKGRKEEVTRRKGSDKVADHLEGEELRKEGRLAGGKTVEGGG
jgi:hypothetical protein